MWFLTESADLDYLKAAPFRFENDGLLPAPPDQVFSVLTDGSSWPLWFKDFVSSTWLTPPPHGVGACREVKLKMLSVKERFLVWEPGRRMAFTVYETTLPLTRIFVEDFQLAPAGEGGSRLRWTVYYTPSTLMRILHPIARPIFAKMFRDALAGLTRHLGQH